MKKATNRFLLYILIFSAVISLFSFASAYAEGDCCLELSFTPEGKAAENVRFRVYKVADVNEKYEYIVIKPFDTESVIKLLEDVSSENYAVAASTLAGMIAADSSILPEDTEYTDSNGTAVFDGLEAGLYLVYGDLHRRGDFVYTPHSFLVCLPKIEDTGTLSFHVRAAVKWEKRQADVYANMRVVKIWSDSAVNLHLCDKVEVAIYKNGELFDRQILCKENNWTYTWKTRVGKDSWAVYERPVTGYYASVERRGDTFIVQNTAVSPYCPVPSGKLPQTGLLWWPIPIMFIVGIGAVMIGISKRKGRRDESK